jgi:Fur family ferric uptake transcriptional regulator
MWKRFTAARLRLFEEAGIVERHEFGDGRARYEETPATHHDHLIDMRSGKVVEFRNEDIERIQHEIARHHGYKLVGHRLELFVLPLDAEKETER